MPGPFGAPRPLREVTDSAQQAEVVPCPITEFVKYVLALELNVEGVGYVISVALVMPLL